MAKEIKTAPPPPSFRVGDMVLYTPETTTGLANNMREYLAVVGQIEEKSNGSVEHHLLVIAPFTRPQWYGNVRPWKRGEARRNSFRSLDSFLDEVPV